MVTPKASGLVMVYRYLGLGCAHVLGKWFLMSGGICIAVMAFCAYAHASLLYGVSRLDVKILVEFDHGGGGQVLWG